MRSTPEQWQSWARLMKRVQQGDGEAYRVLLNEIGPILYGYVRRRVFNQEQVDDVYQEILLTLHRARHAYQSDRPFSPWLFTVARNALLDALGRNRKFVEREVPTETLPDNAGVWDEDHGFEDELYKALQALPESLRRPVELLKIRGLSLQEAADELGIKVGALKVRAHRGYARLKTILLSDRMVVKE